MAAYYMDAEIVDEPYQRGSHNASDQYAGSGYYPEKSDYTGASAGGNGGHHNESEYTGSADKTSGHYESTDRSKDSGYGTEHTGSTNGRSNGSYSEATSYARSTDNYSGDSEGSYDSGYSRSTDYRNQSTSNDAPGYENPSDSSSQSARSTSDSSYMRSTDCNTENGSKGTNDDRFKPYEVTYRGTNSQGNDYDNRTQPCGRGYHYSNTNGSYYYKNGDNSKYYNDGNGSSTYTAPDGKVHKK